MSATQEANIEQLISKHLDKVLPRKLEEIEANKTPSMAIIPTKGTLDWAYPPFILASTGSAPGWDVSVFFTFYGLMTVDVFGFSKDDFIPEIDDYVGAASFLPVAAKSDICLFI